ncbi:MAG: tetratricopeptide repeat protein [Candidatus Obscuribacterales bacterium]|nr:tetratricopeptide repeat protein [Candidatus Obscuribacterales bacterium]
MSALARKLTVLCAGFTLAASCTGIFTVQPLQAEEEHKVQPSGSQEDNSDKNKVGEGKETVKDSPDPNRPFSAECVKAYNAGVTLHQQGFLNQAIQKYKEAITADERIEAAYCNLGLIYCAQKNWARAMDTFKKAIALKKDNPFTLNGMGSVLYSKGKLKEAIEHWQKALEADSKFASAYFNIGNAYENEKDLDKALSNYVLSIKANPAMADAYYKIGCLFAKQKHDAQAKTMLAKAMQLAPDADFANDARKQLTNITGSFTKDESSEDEVKMNVIAPQSPAGETTSEK